MPFDKLDKKAREAAEQYNAAYSEEAWGKMEALLDKHMPQNVVTPELKERKFHEKWLFLLLSLIAVSSIILLIKPWKTNRRNNVPAENIATTKPVSNIENKLTAIKPGDNTNDGYKSSTGNSSINKPVVESQIFSKSKNNKEQKNYTEVINTEKGFTIRSDENKNIIGHSDDLLVKSDNDVAESSNTYLPEEFIKQKITNRVIGLKNVFNDKIFAPGTLKADKIIDAKRKNSYSVKKNKFENSFSLSLSAGPDVSAISLNRIGRVEMLYGAGIGYKFGKRWQLRTGFYSVKKIYEAKPSDYKPPSTFWTYYPDLVDIDANCSVKEIPLILNYTFKRNPKKSLFGSAGISSYFMKRETYDYTSKNSLGQPRYKSYTIYNQNKHYLSSLRLSAGYERTFNNTISITAEPYLNLPLSGVGFGKVKLNSTGLLFSVNVKPFAKK